MTDHRLIAVELDEASILRRSADIERERQVALYDLIEGDNRFRPEKASGKGAPGPYRLRLSTPEGRLAFDIADAGGAPLETVILGMGTFQRAMREYFAICESYYQAVERGGAAQVETVDMARRGLHDDAAERLRDRLAGKIDVDHATARRLFTLICVLHIR